MKIIVERKLNILIVKTLASYHPGETLPHINMYDLFHSLCVCLYFSVIYC